MAQNIERAEALARARKYLEQTTDRGRTEGEMNMAMDRLNKLMTTFKLTMDEISLSTEPCVSLVFDTGTAVEHPSHLTFGAIADYCDVIYYRTRGHKALYRDAEGKLILDSKGRPQTRRTNIKYTFYGFETDVKMAEFLAEMIGNTINLELGIYKKTPEYRDYRGPKKSASHSFGHGMADRIRSRLNEMADAQAQEIEDETQGRGGELMVIKEKRVQDEFKTTGIRLVTGGRRSRRIRAWSGYNAGSTAGGRVNLSRPVGNTSSTLLLS
jgi:hypothetical protein